MDPRVIPTLAFLLAMGGCSYQLVSPPARMTMLESARTAAPGETVGAARGAGHAAVFNPAIVVGSAGVRRGVTEGVDLAVDATYARVVFDEHPDVDRNLYAARVGGKVANGSATAALVGGVGGGFAPAAGGFYAIDAGGIVAYPNCYVVPFANLTLFGSVPTGAKRIVFRDPDGTVRASGTAGETVGFGLGAGLEIPLDRARCREGRTPPRLLLGLNHYQLFPLGGTRVLSSSEGPDDGRTVYGTIGAAVGLEFPL